MSLKRKSLCGFKKSIIEDHFDEIQKVVAEPKFVCGKCARVANDRCFLCKAKKLAHR
ncbi:MAG: hypothetical protein AAGB46_00555 [Verrucomicrobiota bacterium]